MKLFVARHGETDWNNINKVLGRTDIPLNTKGKLQASELAEKLKTFYMNYIFVSPLIRAKETCKIISVYQKSANIMVKAELIEQNFGCFEGVDRNDLNYQKAKRMYIKRYPGGESYFDVVARVYPFIDSLKEFDTDSNILIITHGGICKIIHSYFNDMENEGFATYTTNNCGFQVYEL